MSNHVDRTKDVLREKVFSTATITDVQAISPTIKWLNLTVDNANLTFRPGQWLDLHIPNLPVVGGYSMCSTPALLKKEKQLHLAVKYSDHPPAVWVHTKCTKGDKVSIQIGGEFLYNVAAEGLKQDTLLIGAGVGINPLYSVFKHISEVHECNKDVKKCFGQTTMLYTATSLKELIFKDDMDLITSSHDKMTSFYFVTRETGLNNKNIIERRITEEDLSDAVKSTTSDIPNLIAYLCGPEPMMLSMKGALVKLGLHEDNIRYESWW
ncbi:oxidoreductase NAD-binding domain-containing protein 1-like isoform X2 [Hydractinia symbiolongicarpus]|nr:oxidoreductase NAD-binding domain-containing protein 1-like isoform X2 [Hydractinia symbiolongicarpus]